MTANDWVIDRIARGSKRAKESIRKMLIREIEKADKARDNASRYASKELQREINSLLGDLLSIMNTPSSID